ncbi:hypothetical protein RFI_21941 [Reticulomyxa filosa]|uniref:Aldehyde dehydrogenase domain-containing protein n=1 Tax=Reticulomyxa filosa TaxID=46433 RepID=X6MN71_RETFI|nr:hypothetical protein RFI_21941 [Reticulomyxa filosa]|eukprot:ETO15423.1 hypothetical protein RFI_21941 [Reticulomyxa filosa]
MQITFKKEKSLFLRYVKFLNGDKKKSLIVLKKELFYKKTTPKKILEMLAKISKILRIARRSPRNFSTSNSALLSELGLSDSSDNVGVFNGKWNANGPVIESVNPANNKLIAKVKTGNANDYEKCIEAMTRVKRQWALTPAPKRGEVVRRMGEILRQKKKALGRLVSLENGKILTEGEGEVQEAIDICDFAVGLSRTINGQVIPSERPGHAMLGNLKKKKKFFFLVKL